MENMIFDFGTVAVMSVILTFITAQKKNFFSKLMQNSVTSGLLLSVIKLLIFISQLEYFFKTGDLISQDFIQFPSFSADKKTIILDDKIINLNSSEIRSLAEIDLLK